MTRGEIQDQDGPYVGGRIRHLDQSSIIKHNLENDETHELQIRDKQCSSYFDA